MNIVPSFFFGLSVDFSAIRGSPDPRSRAGSPESTSKHSPTRRRQSSNIFGETEITESETLRLEEGRIVLSPASMEELPDEVVQLNDLVAERLPRVELAEVLIEVDSWTGFTQFFRHRWGSISKSGSGAPRVRGDPGPGLQLIRPLKESGKRRLACDFAPLLSEPQVAQP